MEISSFFCFIVFLFHLQVSYSLTELAKTQLNKDRKEIAPHDIPLMFQTSESLIKLVGSDVALYLRLELLHLLFDMRNGTHPEYSGWTYCMM